MRTPAIALLFGICLSPIAPIRAQSLAEVAKKEEDRRKDGKGSGKVYSNKDLKAPPPSEQPPAPQADTTKPVDGSAASSSPQAGATSAPASTSQGSPVAGKDDLRDRAYWSKRIMQAREQLDRDRVLADALQSRVNSLGTDFVNRDDPAQRAKIAGDRDRTLQELDRQKRAIAADEKAVPAIEDEARRAGVPPGWLR